MSTADINDPLLLAITNHRHREARALLEAGSPVHIKTPDGDPLFLFLLKKGPPDLIKDFIEVGIDVEKERFEGMSAIHWLAKHGRLICVKALIAAQISLRQSLVQTERPVGWSRPNAPVKAKSSPPPLSPSDLAEYNKALCAAVKDSRVTISQFLLGAGADPNASLAGGRTVLFEATDTSIVHALVKAGAQINHQDLEGNTPLHWAAMQKESDVFHDLLKMGADSALLNHRGISPMQVFKEKEAAQRAFKKEQANFKNSSDVYFDEDAYEQMMVDGGSAPEVGTDAFGPALADLEHNERDSAVPLSGKISDVPGLKAARWTRPPKEEVAHQEKNEDWVYPWPEGGRSENVVDHFKSHHQEKALVSNPLPQFSQYSAQIAGPRMIRGYTTDVLSVDLEVGGHREVLTRRTPTTPARAQPQKPRAGKDLKFT